MSHHEVVDWLMQGDPAIRWQVMRDLLDLPPSDWEPERRKVATEGWGKQFLDLQDEKGSWAGGIYTPKWKSTTYTLLVLIDCGLDPENEAARKGADLILKQGIVRHEEGSTLDYVRGNDTCVWGFYLHIATYFGMEHPLLEQLGELLLADQMEDGGWNCRKHRTDGARHGSFHTTFNVLEGLREMTRRGIGDRESFLRAQAKAMEFMLQHRMYRSDKTGRIIKTAFTQISHPPRWHYDVLRGLDYIRETPFAKDPRLEDAIQLLESKGKNNIWPAQNKHAGKTFFPLESSCQKSRWNTLRALRVLKACSPPPPRPCGSSGERGLGVRGDLGAIVSPE